MAKKSDLPAVVHDHFHKANKLHGYVEKELSEATEHALEIGQELSAAKKAIPHGSWEDECKRLFDGSPRTAQFYMEFAKHVSALPKAQASALLMLEGTLDGAAKAAKRAAKPAKPKPSPPKPDAEPIDVPSEPVDDDETPEPDYGKCLSCGGTTWCDEDLADVSCVKCLHPHGEPVGDTPPKQTPDAPDVAESAGTRLRDALEEVIADWHEMFPKAPNCLIGSILESLAGSWKSDLED